VHRSVFRPTVQLAGSGDLLITKRPLVVGVVAEGRSHSGLVYVPRERTIGEMVRGLRRLADVFMEAETSDRVEFL